MATINSKEYIDQIIAANGQLYEEDPPVTKIVEYINAWGKVTWGVVFQGEQDQNRYEVETEYVRSPKIFWQREEQV